MIGSQITFGGAATRRRGAARARPDAAPPPEPWPEGAAAVWLILGQSNADGYAPAFQDPARLDPAAAVPALSAQERAFHPWLRVSTQGLEPQAGQFRTAGQGIATVDGPRTSLKVWNNPGLGIPSGTPAFGPEIGLVRYTLGAAPPSWRDDLEPRLWLFKQTNGGSSVDFFRWGGAGQQFLLGALRQGGNVNLQSLATTRPVLLQGVIFVIGERDANDPRPGGAGTMADTLAPRFADWVRQVRGALGTEAPVAFVEVFDAADARKRTVNEALAAVAAALPNAAVIGRQPDWTTVGDDIHYDAQGQDRIGAAAFGHLRTAHGRPGDGLVTGYPFTGLKPWFHVPPVFIDDIGTKMQLAVTPAVSGVLHARVTAQGAPVPAAEEIRDLSLSPGGFRRSVTADADLTWFTPSDIFDPSATQDCHFVLIGADGTIGERATVRRGANVKFQPDLAVGTVGADAATCTLTPSFSGVLHWSLFAGDRGWMRPEDVEAMAFLPLQAGETPCGGGQATALAFSGLAGGTLHTLFVTGRRDGDGVKSVTQRVQFVTA